MDPRYYNAPPQQPPHHGYGPPPGPHQQAPHAHGPHGNPFGAPLPGPYGYQPPGFGATRPPVEPESRSVARVLIAVGVSALIAALVFGLGWRSFLRFGESSDLMEYSSDLRSAEFENEHQRDELLERVRGVRNEIRDKEVHIPFFVWIGHDEVFQSVLWDGYVDADEAVVLHEELDRMER